MADLLVIGCGYLGRHVADRRREAGLSVFAATRSPHRADEFHRLGLEPVLCDVLEPDSLRALPAGADVVYCVGFDRTAGKTMRNVYVDGLENVLNALDAADQGRFVYVSSTGVYGQSRGEEVDETAATNPAGESGRIVLDAEDLIRERRPDAVILHFAGIYGPDRLIRACGVESRRTAVGRPGPMAQPDPCRRRRLGRDRGRRARTRGASSTYATTIRCDDAISIYGWPKCLGRRRRGLCPA